jgi:fibronectin-binding autotransporter adhesin
VSGGAQTAYLDSSITNEIDLVVSVPIANLTWVGDGSDNNWDIGVTKDWFNTGTSSAAYYADGASVTFTDTGSKNPAVNLVGLLQPGSILVTNNTGAYTFGGGGYLGGPTGLTKTGAGTLIITNSGNNVFTGQTSVTGGTLSISADSALGTPPPASVANQLTLNGGTLQTTANMNLSTTRGISLGAAGGVLQPEPAGGTLTAGGQISGAGLLTVNGGGTLIMGGSNYFTNQTIVVGATVSISADSGLGLAPATVVTNQLTLNGGTLQTTSGMILATNRGIALGASGGLLEPINGSTLTLGGLINGAGSLTVTGNGTLLLDQANPSFTGSVLISGGTVDAIGGLDFGGVFGEAGSITITNGTLDASGAAIAGDNGNNAPFGNPGTFIPGNVTLQYGGVLTIGGDNTTAHIPRLLVLSGGELDSALLYSISASYGSWDLEQGVLVTNTTATSVISASGVACNQTGGTVFNVASEATNGIDLDVTGYFGSYVGTAAAVLIDAGLVKTGAGVMRLDGNNTYTNKTIISNGVLVLSASGSMAATAQILVSKGATFDVSAYNPGGGFTLNSGQLLGGAGVVTGLVTVASGAMLSPAAAPSTLSFSNDLTLNGSTTNYFELSAPVVGPNNQIAVAGNLTLNGVNAIQINSSALGSGRYKLFTYGGTLTGNTNNLLLTSITLGAGQTANLDDSITNEIDLVVIGVPNGPTSLTYSFHTGTLKLSWPPPFLGWILASNSVSLSQTNSWFDIAGSGSVTNLSAVVNDAKTNVFFRLHYP